MICPACGHSNSANAAQYAACATPLPAKIQIGGTQNSAGNAPVYSANLPKGVRLQNGDVDIRVSSFNKGGGSPDQWNYHASYSY